MVHNFDISCPVLSKPILSCNLAMNLILIVFEKWTERDAVGNETLIENVPQHIHSTSTNDAVKCHRLL